MLHSKPHVSTPHNHLIKISFHYAGCLHNFNISYTKRENNYLFILFPVGVYLSCKHNVKKEVGARVEWKKIKGSTVSFVYLNGVFVVPPSAPVCEVPVSALSGTVVELRCKESEGVPASKYRWYRNGAILPESTFFWSFKKEKKSYTLNTTTGTLLFNPVSKNDTGEYYCEAYNRVGRPRRCPVKRMQVDDLNVSAIIASVVIVALIMASCGLGVYYAQKKGYFSSKYRLPFL
uniref:Junctional adhesion molecule 2 n=1 Tax=Pseudonaja textilis TaxID=8673 RepID=A0A670YB77_PSETE